VLAAVDLGGRFGNDGQAFGYRLNVATNAAPDHPATGRPRQLLAWPTDWRINKDTVLEAEMEWSHKRQPSQAGYSLLGNRPARARGRTRA
jgi:iron complex outermembrane receptor protein